MRGAREGDEPCHWEEKDTKALVPGEEGNYTIRISEFPSFCAWRDARCDIVVNGRMVYAIGDDTFHTEFEATLRYSEALDQTGNVKTRWRNRVVV